MGSRLSLYALFVCFTCLNFLVRALEVFFEMPLFFRCLQLLAESLATMLQPGSQGEERLAETLSYDFWQHTPSLELCGLFSSICSGAFVRAEQEHLTKTLESQSRRP